MGGREWREANPDKMRGYARAWRERNPELNLARQRQWTKENPKSRMLIYARNRAKKLGLPFNLNIDDIFIPEKCPCLGILLRSRVGCGPGPESPSLDRINPALGYVKGNVWVISARANVIKNDATPEELVSVAEAIRAKVRRGDLW